MPATSKVATCDSLENETFIDSVMTLIERSLQYGHRQLSQSDACCLLSNDCGAPVRWLNDAPHSPHTTIHVQAGPCSGPRPYDVAYAAEMITRVIPIEREGSRPDERVVSSSAVTSFNVFILYPVAKHTVCLLHLYNSGRPSPWSDTSN